MTLYLLFVLAKKVETKFSAARTTLYAILIIALFSSVVRIYIRAEDFKNTWNLALSAVEVSPNSVKTWNNLAKEFGMQEKYQEAVGACNKGISIYPRYPTLLKNRIYFLVAMKKYHEAEINLRKIIKMGSKDHEMYNLLGGIVIKKDTPESFLEAEKLLQESLKLKPEQPIIRKTLEQLQKDIKVKNPN